MIIEIIKTACKEWKEPKIAIHSGNESPFLLQCSYIPAQKEIFEEVIPKPLLEFWSFAESSKLFEDIQFGQWGLELLSRESSEKTTQDYRVQRYKDALAGDLVIGRFLGDSDLLVIRCDKGTEDYGRVLIALPIDSRDQWYIVSDSLDSFIKQYIANQGGKFWE